MIVVRSLTKRFGSFQALDSLDFKVPEGSVAGFLGPNGAGKTTTIRLISGFLTPTRGSVSVGGLDVQTRRREVQRLLGYLPEAAPLYGEMRVREFLKYRARLFGVERGRRKRATDLVVKRCSLEEVERRPIHQLSKGYRQRVGLAAALLHQPPVLILDEPTVGLDPAQIREVRGLIRELAARHTILVSTHILQEVELTCDYLIMIARGRIQAHGTLDEVRSRGLQTSKYVVETDSRKADQILRDLAGVDDVHTMPLESNWRRLTLTASAKAGDLREAIAAALAQATCTVRELRREVPSLEHLFVQMIADAEAEHASSEARSALAGAAA